MSETPGRHEAYADTKIVANRSVQTFALRSSGGLTLRVTDYGCIIMSLLAPDRDGHTADIVLGYDSPADYQHDPRPLGAVIGRCANRISNSSFTLDGRTHRLTPNVGRHHLHGGRKGFDKIEWQGKPFAGDSTSGVVFEYTSPDGEEGYPGTLQCRVTYTLTEKNEVIVDYWATTDRPTPVNLTQHSYFNLRGRGAGDVLGHVLYVNADRFTPLDRELIVTGEIASVRGTAYDFRSLTSIGARVPGSGYDINYVLNGRGPGLIHAARVEEPDSGRTLDVHTTEPGMQLYTGDGSAFCLETQHFPDAVNHPDFPSVILRPGTEYRSRTIFTFGVSHR